MKELSKFFGKRSIKPDDVKTTLDENIEKLKEITVISTDVTTLTKFVSEIITDVTAIKDDFSAMKEQLEKVKSPHTKFSNIVYTRKSGTLEWTPTNNVIIMNSTVAGIHRLTLVSHKQFIISSIGSTGTNNVISTVIEKDATVQFTITPVDLSIQK